MIVYKLSIVDRNLSSQGLEYVDIGVDPRPNPKKM